MATDWVHYWQAYSYFFNRICQVHGSSMTRGGKISLALRLTKAWAAVQPGRAVSAYYEKALNDLAGTGDEKGDIPLWKIKHILDNAPGALS